MTLSLDLEVCTQEVIHKLPVSFLPCLRVEPLVSQNVGQAGCFITPPFVHEPMVASFKFLKH